ncbi:MAG: corrinoid protein [Betaproteobacteria bacterium]|nr:corrinoid protein [Betaproteobacteria bacterium]
MAGEIETIRDLCVRGKRAELNAAVTAAISAGLSAQEIMGKGLIPAMSIVGERYSSGEFFLPQMMIAARAMQEAVAALKPLLTAGAYETRAKAVIGTVAGDFHDIGKNIVKIMLEGQGYEVVDLGVDASAEKFVEAVRNNAPQFVLMSALITLTMESMRKTVQALEAAGLRGSIWIGVGGAPLTKKFADEIGADFYSEDAYQCVEACNAQLH